MGKLQEFIKNKSNKISIMEGREKDDIRSLLEKTVTINNFDFLVGDNGKYAVFTIKEDEGAFYFGSSVVTDELEQIESNGLKQEVIEEGLKVKLEERKTKNGKRTYIAMTYVD